MCHDVASAFDGVFGRPEELRQTGSKHVPDAGRDCIVYCRQCLWERVRARGRDCVSIEVEGMAPMDDN